MATKSFVTDFKFNSKSASALSNALSKSKRVDIRVMKPVNYYKANDSRKLTNKFDSIFKKES